jgi:hypothetical protein
MFPDDSIQILFFHSFFFQETLLSVFFLPVLIAGAHHLAQPARVKEVFGKLAFHQA